MKLAILGSRGIPNNYGGFEQFATFLSRALAQKNVEVWVYCSHNHPYSQSTWNGVNLIHCYDPEYLIGQAGQYLYDFNCILDSRSRNFDIILQLGYTSNSIWYWMLPKKPIIITNMDGLEWKRSKYSSLVRKLLRFSEKLAVKSSDVLVADSPAIKAYIESTYTKSAVYIPYGAECLEKPNPGYLDDLALKPKGYFLVIARLQPDNHIEEIIRGVVHSKSRLPLVIIGNQHTKYARQLTKKYSSTSVIFRGSEFNQERLNVLRYYCAAYFHGHSAGGTNPSLLEAMAASAPIYAHKNKFNQAVCGDDVCYFETSKELSALLNEHVSVAGWASKINNNLNKIREVYSWDMVFEQYMNLFDKAVRRS
jgi:glycosyltransferase involved in cell wall biosynthesis